MAPLHLWGRHRGARLGAEEGHQDGPEIQQVPGMATEETVPSSTSEVWACAEAQGPGAGLPGPADADDLGQDRYSCADQGAVGVRSLTAERL